ncbi:MAG: cytochrome c peroxidase [Hyphomicrobiaceae bacterium]
MSRGKRSGAARVVLPALLLAAGTAAAAAAERVGVEEAWRGLFRRQQEAPAPADNPSTAAKVALGAQLFSDPRLSGTGRRSCASCHQPERSFSDGRARARGLGGRPLRRNTPALWNLAWSGQYFWDGRAPSLEAQVLMPIAAADEMAGDWPSILRQLGSDPTLVAAFQAAFAEQPAISEATIAKALAAYLRSLISPPTRFDAWIAGDNSALKPHEVSGFRIFTGKAGCVLCHVGWRFTDDRFHDIGLPGTDAGRGDVTGGTPGLPAFKTPSLRELGQTAPYMHDGSKPTLAAVVKHYAGGVLRRASVAPNIKRDLSLTAGERADLIAFLRTLSSERPAGLEQAGRR